MTSFISTNVFIAVRNIQVFHKLLPPQKAKGGVSRGVGKDGESVEELVKMDGKRKTHLILTTESSTQLLSCYFPIFGETLIFSASAA